jgi:hypothetical protein
MTWTPRYNASFAKPIGLQLLALIQRDQRAALDWAGSPSNALKDFQSYQVSPLSIKQFPAVMVSPTNILFSHESQRTRESTQRFYVAIAVAHQDSQVLSQLVQDYLRAVDAILSTVEPYDFYQALNLDLMGLGPIVTAALDPLKVKVMELFIASHNYDEIRQAKTGFQCAAVLELHIDMEEI